jgi:2-oxo-4-hydroxy-4-carboxy-5-ureidoimidazoline decarboxylase
MLNLSQVNAFERHEFTRVFAPLFEHSPWIAARAAARRPFSDRGDFFAALCDTVMKANEEEKLGLIRAHPDLVGHALLTPESGREQASAGLGEISPEERQQFREFNARYKERFGFPFVICARLNKKEAILEAFPRRLANAQEQEIETALSEIFKIADLRLRDLVE